MVTQQMIDAARMAGDNHTHSERADPNGYWRAALEAALAAAWVPSEEHVREGVRLIKAWERLRTPPYSLPSDATITETVRAILALPAPPKE